MELEIHNAAYNGEKDPKPKKKQKIVLENW